MSKFTKDFAYIQDLNEKTLSFELHQIINQNGVLNYGNQKNSRNHKSNAIFIQTELWINGEKFLEKDSLNILTKNNFKQKFSFSYKYNDLPYNSFIAIII